MKRKRQKREAAFTAFLIILLAVQTGCAAKDEAALPDGLFVQEDRIVTADAGNGASDTGNGVAETEDGMSQAPDGGKSSAEGEKTDAGSIGKPTDAAPTEITPEYVYVYICGEVQHPGVYRMPQDSRIFQAVEQAGGLLDTAEETAVNQALAIEDGMKVRIPSKEEAGADSSGSQFVESSTQTKDSTRTEDNRVNLNTATENELCTLTGIGESRAKSIIQYRNEHGNFQKIEDIMKVTGIKDGAFAKIRDEIVVE